MRKSLWIVMAAIISNGWAVELLMTEELFGVSAVDERLDILSEGLNMPPIMKHGQVPVLNQGGGMRLFISIQSVQGL